eukprot:CAMPEP_0185254310 /NCGR_PEP_ID=MMETSP1359-20130426/3049_1 /TAXON_ID=552665 /ORGANISM="Bigelowiella longifila, Strain CCMP242" /LENGTH=402 /DNA_ID=CAMNT_0027837191 /DNA_START=292 /DNA_END=1500 /DNA_ORIENTATION=-
MANSSIATPSSSVRKMVVICMRGGIGKRELRIFCTVLLVLASLVSLHISLRISSREEVVDMDMARKDIVGGKSSTALDPSGGGGAFQATEFRLFRGKSGSSSSNNTRCLHTKQGKRLVADSSGAVCLRKDVKADGCCKGSISALEDHHHHHHRHHHGNVSCGTCHEELQCCESYEYCVSCCSNREQNQITTVDIGRASSSSSSSSSSNSDSKNEERVPDIATDTQTNRSSTESNRSSHLLGEINEGKIVAGENTAEAFAIFNKCAARCRVTSKMLIHGNKYRHKYIHCFWDGEKEPQLSSAILNPTIKKSTPGSDCATACANEGMTCHEDFFSQINSCEVMKDHFSCGGSGCKSAKNPSAPSFSASSHDCLVNDGPAHYDCEGTSERHTRLCLCIARGDVYR